MDSPTMSYEDESIKTINNLVTYMNTRGNQDFIHNILQYVKDQKGDLVKMLTEEYKLMAKKHKREYNLDEDFISSSQYFREMMKLYENEFKCIERATNSYESQFFIYNVLQTFYSLLYPKNLNYFGEFVSIVTAYLKHRQSGNVCVFEGPREILHDGFFSHVIVGCMLAFSYFKAVSCRKLNTTIKGMGLKLTDQRYKALRKEYKKTCGFFDSIDTASFQTLISEKLGYGEKKGGRRSNLKKSRRRAHKKSIKRRTIKRKRK